ncbi:MAG: hypothetical protein BGO31_16435 [Bacteroidetes bacterium 43-16]|nr:MAG: hypothetical protein BGO31_16435 [Bacteroidetes bacterium 43-16]
MPAGRPSSAENCTRSSLNFLIKKSGIVSIAVKIFKAPVLISAAAPHPGNKMYISYHFRQSSINFAANR